MNTTEQVSFLLAVLQQAKADAWAKLTADASNWQVYGEADEKHWNVLINNI